VSIRARDSLRIMGRRLILHLALAGTGLMATAQTNQPAKKLGDYTIESDIPNASCGIDRHGGYGQLTNRILYKERTVTDTSFFAFVSPYNPSRIMYSVSPSCGENESQVGTFYFEPSRKQAVKVRVLGTGAPAEELDAMWSPDDKFALLSSSKMDFVLVNLATGESTNLSNRLYIGGSVMSTVAFRGWSPDGKRLALVVSSTLNRAGGGLRTESDLISFDPAALTPTYLATMRKNEGWIAGDFTWAKSTGRFDLAVAPAIQNSAGIYVKPAAPVFHPLPDYR
jgi:hypothetical protein